MRSPRQDPLRQVSCQLDSAQMFHIGKRTVGGPRQNRCSTRTRSFLAWSLNDFRCRFNSQSKCTGSHDRGSCSVLTLGHHLGCGHNVKRLPRPETINTWKHPLVVYILSQVIVLKMCVDVDLPLFFDLFRNRTCNIPQHSMDRIVIGRHRIPQSAFLQHMRGQHVLKMRRACLTDKHLKKNCCSFDGLRSDVVASVFKA